MAVLLVGLIADCVVVGLIADCVVVGLIVCCVVSWFNSLLCC